MNNRRNVHLSEFISDLRATAPIWVLSAVAAGAAAYGAFKRLDAAQREAAIFGALVFLVLAGFVLYEVIRRATDQIAGTAGRDDICSLITAPHHARLVPSGASWRTDGTVWIGVACTEGSRLEATLSVPAGVQLQWVNEEMTPAIWELKGTAGGATTWSVEVTRSQTVTPLGQFTLETDTNVPQRFISIKLRGSSPSGIALDEHAKVVMLPHVDMAMKPLSEANASTAT